MTSHQALFEYNCLQQGDSVSILRFEQQWAARHLMAYGHFPDSLEQFHAELGELLEHDGLSMTSGDYIANHIDLAGLKKLIACYGVDGLTEAQAMFAAVPRLPLAAQMPLMRIIIDEFGCGNLQKTHTQFFINLLKELNLPDDLRWYVDHSADESFEFVNIYHWLTSRAPSIDYYLGALAYTEGIIPYSFKYYLQCCDRLSIKHSDYFSEHIHIDGEFHYREALNVIKIFQQSNPINWSRVWSGVQLARKFGDQVVDRGIHAVMNDHRQELIA